MIATGSPFSRANAATWAAHLRGGTAARDWLVQARRSSGPLAISVVSLTEIGGGMRPPERREVIRLLASMQRFEVTERVAWRAATLMQQYRRSHSGIGPGGYLIAATALTEGLELATLNVRHYPMSRIGAPVLSLRRRSERAAGGHARAMTIRSVGVEEELLLVDPGSGQPLAVAETALEAAETVAGETGDRADDDAAETLAFELQRQQLETNSKPCHDLAELAGELRRCRSLAAEVAGRAGARIAALGTSPAPVVPQLVREGRYLRMARAFGPIATGQLTCGCHVHVEVPSADEAAAALDRIRPWLAVLLAISANSPFWQGQDSSYASFRYQEWGRWPSAGPTEPFGTAEGYRRAVRQMVSTGTLLDTGMVYFDARLSEHYPTLEIRIADVCLCADDAVLLAALCRALVDTEARRWRAGEDVPRQRMEMLRLAAWRASRSGLDDALLNPRTGLPEPAGTVAKALFDHVRDALDEAGDTTAVNDLLAAVLSRGNGAAFQRAAYRDGGMSRMIDGAADATTR